MSELNRLSTQRQTFAGLAQGWVPDGSIDQPLQFLPKPLPMKRLLALTALAALTPLAQAAIVQVSSPGSLGPGPMTQGAVIAARLTTRCLSAIGPAVALPE